MNFLEVAKAIRESFFEGYKLRYKTYSLEGAEVAWRDSESFVAYEVARAQYLKDISKHGST